MGPPHVGTKTFVFVNGNVILGIQSVLIKLEKSDAFSSELASVGAKTAL